MAIDRRGFIRAREIFTEALLREGEERALYVEAMCEGDQPLRDEVNSLLACYTVGADPLDRPLPWDETPAVPERIGPYRVHELVGQGGMGVVYRAQADGDDAPIVALKVLRAGMVTAQVERRFRREIEVLQRLDHPGIARLLDAGSADGAPYLAMEFIDGVSLARWRTEVQPSLSERLRLLAELAEAVHFANQHDVVHRDLKPENILVTPDGQPKVLDFGIARLMDGSLPSQSLATQTWQLLGTIRYMSPEQATGGPSAVDARTDVYALGVIAYELLTGELPYDLNRLSTPRALLEITASEPRRFAATEPGLRGEVERIVLHALEKQPDRRYKTAGAMAADLRAHLAGKPIALRAPDLLSRARRALRRRPRVRRVVLGGGIAAAAVIGTLVIWPGLRVEPASWDRVFARLDEADQLRHAGPSTSENYLAAAALFQSARGELARMPEAPYSNDLARYIKWRLGELSYFLAGADHEVVWYEQARGCWHDAVLVPWSRGSAVTIPVSAIARGKVMRLGHHHPWSGVGMVQAALGELRAPATHYRLAVEAQRNAVELCDRGTENYHYDDFPPELEAEDQAYAWLNLGAGLSSLGAAVDSLALIDRGLARLQEAMVHPGIRDSGARAGVHQALGTAFLARAETGFATLDPGDVAAALDSVWVHLDRAREFRDLGSARTYWSLYRLRGLAADIAATLATGEIQRRRLLADGIADLRQSLVPLRDDADAYEVALSRADLAVLEARVARDEGTLAGFAHADSLLASSEKVFSVARFPLQHAETALLRGRVLTMRWELTALPADSLAAEHALERARTAVPHSEYPALTRRVAATLQQLRGKSDDGRSSS